MKTAAYIFAIVLGSALLWVLVFILYAYWQNRRNALLTEVNITLPKSWKELTEKQLLYISALMIDDNTLTEIQSKCFFHFGKIKVLKAVDPERWLCKIKQGKFILQEYEVLFFSKKLSFLTSGINEVDPLPRLRGQKHIQPQFKGVSFRQWFNAENYYQAYLYTKDEYYLNCLCTVIYCRTDKFDISKIDKWSKKFRKLSIIKRFTVFIYYSGLKDRLSKEFKYFFQRLNNVSTQESSPPPNMREYLDNMLQALNLGDITKNEQLLERDVWDAFAMLDKISKENQEIQNRLNKMKK